MVAKPLASAPIARWRAGGFAVVIDDADRIGFATKPKLGLAMLERAHAAGLPFAPRAAAGSRSCRDGSAAGRWVTADSVYGADSTLRRWLQARRLGYVLAVTKAQRLGLARVEDRFTELLATAWQRLSAGDGAKGSRLYDWAYLPYGLAGRRGC